MKTTSIILDFETLSTTPDAVIIQVGAIAVNRSDFAIYDTLDHRPEIFGQLTIGRQWDTDTIRWHMKNGTIITNPGKITIEQSIRALSMFITHHNPHRIWAWGKDFERPLYENLCRRLSIAVPDYQFRSFACARDQWQNAFGMETQAPKRTHQALQDCKDELRDLHQALTKLNLKHVF
jgi:hypothetical protein